MDSGMRRNDGEGAKAGRMKNGRARETRGHSSLIPSRRARRIEGQPGRIGSALRYAVFGGYSG